MATAARPKPLHGSRSFTRMEAAAPLLDRKRASTLQGPGIPAIPEARKIEAPASGHRSISDVFENNEDDDAATDGVRTPGPELKLPSTFEDLPIEIRSLAERFLESLNAKVHPTPLNADQLSELFQEFYERAASHIATHIASLASRIGRRSTSQSSLAKASLKGRPRAGSGAKGISPEPSVEVAGGEMLTASEVADRKKARRLLELKRLALEEAVERDVCEKIYEKIWKHRSTDDEARDEKLCSRTAALALVGIGLKELHMDQDGAKADVRKMAEEKEDEINQSLAAARDALVKMDEEHYPLGKLQHLTAAHKSIVETLSQIFPSSSSADEILPTLIYTLITSPSNGMNVVSNLTFIQRFRASNKVDGEAAYCMVNLEAAISFLETVDLSSLRADELPEGPPKSSSRPSTPLAGNPPLTRPTVARTLTPGLTPVSVTSSDQSNDSSSAIKALPSPVTPTTSARPQMHRRRLSSLMQAQAEKLEAGRENFLNTADKIYDSINGTLDNSLQFIFGRFKEQIADASDSSPSLPKTLEEARQLVNSPNLLADDDETFSVGERSGRSSPSVVDDPLSSASRTDGKLLELVGGRRQLRDHSVDSARSGGSGKRVAFAAAASALTPRDAGKEDVAPASSAQPANLFASINPLNRFGMPAFPRFGRLSPAATQAPATAENNTRLGTGEMVASPGSVDGATSSSSPPAEKQRNGDGKNDFKPATLDLNAREALAELRKIKPPRQRFLEVPSAAELKIGEVEDLLLEYRRLAKAIADAIAL